MHPARRESVVRPWAIASCFLAACLALHAPAQTDGPEAPVPSTPARTAAKPLAEVPFEFFANKIYLQVLVNGRGPYPLAFDTGSPTPVLYSELAKELEINPGMPMPIGGAGEGSMKGSVAGNVKFEIPIGGDDKAGKLDLGGPATALIPIDGRLGPSSGHKLMGLVGNNIATRYTVAVDYAAGVMRFYDAASYEYAPPEGKEKGHELRVRLRGHTFLTAAVTPQHWEERQPIKGSFILDTGARISVTLTSPFVNDHDLLNERVPSVLAISGHGIGGPLRHHAARLTALDFAGFTIDRPVAFLSQDKSGVLARGDIAGIIGADILKKFTLILDYKRHRVILEPNEHFAEPIEFNMSGIWLTAEGDARATFTVGDIDPNSPAAAAGLKAGDVLTAIDGKPASQWTFDTIHALFKQDDRTVKLRVKSGEAEREVELVLKRRV